MLVITVSNARRKLRVFAICALVFILVLAAALLLGRSPAQSTVAENETPSAYPGEPVQVTTNAEEYLDSLLEAAGYRQE